MMRRHLSTIGIAALLLLLSGCPFRKKQPPVPQTAQAPTTPAPEPAPPPETKPEETQPPPPPPEAPPEKTETTAEKPKPKKKPSAKKPATPAAGQQAAAATPAPTQTSKLIIQEGPTPNSQGQQAASVGLEESSARNKQTTEQLLQSARTNLNSINRPLSPEEQAMVAQIKDYIAQSVKATKDSDTVRAHNLAVKARLLSDELVKH